MPEIPAKITMDNFFSGILIPQQWQLNDDMKLITH